MIARLFAIEADIKGRPPAERLAARRAKATPILSELRAFLDATMEKISGKSSLAGAFRYAASRWTALTLRPGDSSPSPEPGGPPQPAYDPETQAIWRDPSTPLRIQPGQSRLND
jgi:Transposase IS66 family